MDLSKLTQDQLDKLLADKEAAETLAKQQADKIKNTDDNSEKLKELDTLRKQNEDSQTQLLKIKVDTRVSQVNKWLESKDGKENIIAQLSKMSDGEFDLFKEGKINEDFKTKDEIEQERTAFETQKNEFENNKEKIIKEAADSLKKEVPVKEPAIVPNTEVDSGTPVKPEDIGPGEGKFPTMNTLKDMFNLDENPLYDLKEGHEMKAEKYLDKSYSEDKQGYGY